MKIDAEAIRQLATEAGLKVDAQSLQERVPLREQGLDSLDVFDLYLAMEERTGVTIPDEDLEKLKTISDIVEYVTALGD